MCDSERVDHVSGHDDDGGCHAPEPDMNIMCVCVCICIVILNIVVICSFLIDSCITYFLIWK